jgi:hypothetical protein
VRQVRGLDPLAHEVEHVLGELRIDAGLVVAAGALVALSMCPLAPVDKRARGNPLVAGVDQGRGGLLGVAGVRGEEGEPAGISSSP